MKITGVDSEEGCQSLWQDIDQIESQAEYWQIEFNHDKCEVMYFSKSYRGRTYTVNGGALGNVNEQRDYGDHHHSSLRMVAQVDRVAKKADSCLLSQVGVQSWDALQFYKTLVRPHVEYFVQTKLPRYKKDVITLGRVQRFTRLLLGFVDFSYGMRLDRLGLFF